MLEYGFDSHLAKPIDIAAFEQLICSIQGQRAFGKKLTCPSEKKKSSFVSGLMDTNELLLFAQAFCSCRSFSSSRTHRAAAPR